MQYFFAGQKTMNDQTYNCDLDLIIPFFKETYKSRIRILAKRKGGREKVIQGFPHLMDEKLCKEYIVNCDGNNKEIQNTLLKMGAGDSCYVISENKSLDQKTINLEKAINSTVGYGMGTFLICIPKKLAFFCGEEINDNKILFRKKVAL